MAFPTTAYDSDGAAFAGLVSVAAANGYQVEDLTQGGMLAAIVANILEATPPDAITIGDIVEGSANQIAVTNSGGTASVWADDINAPGSVTATTFLRGASAGIGGAAVSNKSVLVTGNRTAATALALGADISPTLVAAANSDVLGGLRVVPAFTPGAFTGLVARGLQISAYSVAAFTSPGDPIGLDVGVVTATGATNAYAIKLGAGPTGATNNYLFHATNAQITAAGAANFATTGTFGTGITVTTGGATITGNSTITGTLGGLTGLTVASGGAAITGNSTITGTLGGLTGLTVASGGASITGATAIVGAGTFGDPAAASAHVFAGTGYGAGVASIRLNGLTSGAAAETGTLTNAPAAGNPAFWIPINIAGTVRHIPAW